MIGGGPTSGEAGNGTDDYDKDSIGARLRFYERRSQTTVWLGAGLAGLIVVVTSDVGQDVLSSAPVLFRSVILTLLLISGGALARARASYETTVAKIKNRQWTGSFPNTDEKKKLMSTELPDNFKPRGGANGMYVLSLGSILLAAGVFLFPVWWWVGF